MKPGLSTTVLKSLNSVFKKYPEIKSVWLYGSRATGRFKPHSDIDLAVHFKKQPALFARIEWDLRQLNLLHKIDTLDYASISNEELKSEIDQHHLVIFP